MGKGVLKTLWTFHKTIILILTPFVLLPIPLLYTEKSGRCAYAIAIMATYWMSEALPIAVTALLPIVLFPWMGVVGSKQICMNYLKDTNFLFFGGLIVAVAVERWNLHKRIALRVLLLVGSQPKWLIFGFMATTGFLSMWLSNTATAAMMVPIAQAVLNELEGNMNKDEDESSPVVTVMENGKVEKAENHPLDQVDTAITIGPVSVSNGKVVPAAALDDPEELRSSEQLAPEQNRRVDKGAFLRLAIGLKLSICYAANIGGTATLTGTGPNLILKGQTDVLYGTNSGLNFSSWFIFAFPAACVILVVAWLWLCIFYLGPKAMFPCLFKKKVLPQDDTAARIIMEEYRKLGPMSFAEIGVLIHFIVLALMWFSREPEFVKGWGAIPILEPGFVTDACVGVTIAMGLFMFPSKRPNFLCFRRKDDTSDPAPVPALLDWDTVQSKMAWSVIIVLGGGFALADACKESGLSNAIGGVFISFTNIPTWALVMLLSTVTAAFTEIASNTATATIFIPILAELAETIGVHPFYLIIPVTISASFAFMLPVATPPNAIVFAFGQMRIIDMVKTGIVMNILSIGILQIAINTWGYTYFGLGDIPKWITPPNGTMEDTLLVNVTTMPLL